MRVMKEAAGKGETEEQRENRRHRDAMAVEIACLSGHDGRVWAGTQTGQEKERNKGVSMTWIEPKPKEEQGQPQGRGPKDENETDKGCPTLREQRR